MSGPSMLDLRANALWSLVLRDEWTIACLIPLALPNLKLLFPPISCPFCSLARRSNNTLALTAGIQSDQRYAPVNLFQKKVTASRCTITQTDESVACSMQNK